MLSTVYAEITPIKNLTIRTQFGADYSHSTAFMQSFPSYIINNASGTAGRNSSDMLNLTETTTINYRWDMDSDNSFNFLLGQEGVDYRSEGFQVITRGQSSDFLTNISSGTRAASWADSTTSYSYLYSSAVENIITKICIMLISQYVPMLLHVLEQETVGLDSGHLVSCGI